MKREKIYYFVFEGNDRRTDDLVKQFTDENKALRYAYKSRYNFIIVNKYRGELDDEMAEYLNTIYEKK